MYTWIHNFILPFLKSLWCWFDYLSSLWTTTGTKRWLLVCSDNTLPFNKVAEETGFPGWLMNCVSGQLSPDYLAKCCRGFKWSGKWKRELVWIVCILYLTHFGHPKKLLAWARTGKVCSEQHGDSGSHEVAVKLHLKPTYFTWCGNVTKFLGSPGFRLGRGMLFTGKGKSFWT